MRTDYSTKQAARQAIWDRLMNEKLAAFPFPPHGRIPNFKGAKDAALRLFDEPEWRDAKLIKVNPDSPQKYVRAEALRRGIRVCVPTPRLKAGFLKLDPAKIPYDSIHDASQMSKSAKWAEPVALTRGSSSAPRKRPLTNHPSHTPRPVVKNHLGRKVWNPS